MPLPRIMGRRSGGPEPDVRGDVVAVGDDSSIAKLPAIFKLLDQAALGTPGDGLTVLAPRCDMAKAGESEDG